MSKNCIASEKEFYGTATVGERGQIVIPLSARKALNIEKGEKILIFGMGTMLTCVKFTDMEKFASHLSSKVDSIKTLLKKTK